MSRNFLEIKTNLTRSIFHCNYSYELLSNSLILLEIKVKKIDVKRQYFYRQIQLFQFLAEIDSKLDLTKIF